MHGDHYDFSWGFQHRVVLIKMGVTMIVVRRWKQNGGDVEDLNLKKYNHNSDKKVFSQ